MDENGQEWIDAKECTQERKCRIPVGGKHSTFLCYLDDADPTHDLSFRGLDSVPDEYRSAYKNFAYAIGVD